MNQRRLACLAFTAILVSNINAQREKGAGVGPVPKAWDEEAIATLEIPLANPIGSPKHVSSEYYYSSRSRQFTEGVRSMHPPTSRRAIWTG